MALGRRFWIRESRTMINQNQEKFRDLRKESQAWKYLKSYKRQKFEREKGTGMEKDQGQEVDYSCRRSAHFRETQN